MLHDYEVLSKERIRDGDLIPDGRYKFLVEKFEPEINQFGDPQIKLELKLTDKKSGATRKFFPFLYYSKLGEFALAIGQYQTYENRTIDFLAQGSTGECDIVIYRPKGKKPKNIVSCWVDAEIKGNDKKDFKESILESVVSKDIDDDIPL